MKDILSIGLLVNASFKKFNPVRKNTKMKNQYANSNGSDAEMHSGSTRMVHKKFIDPLQKIETKTRTVVKEYTLPWEDRGNRLVTAEMVPALQEALVPLRRDWANAVEEFVVEYDKIVADARDKLKGDFRPELYPSASDIRNRFQFNVIFMPMPDNSRLIESVREEMEDIFNDRINEASANLRQRLMDKLLHLSDKCKSLANGDKMKFYESNLSNVLDLCNMIPDMLIKEDDELLEVANEAKKLLANINSDLLKESDITSATVSRQARELANALI